MRGDHFLDHDAETLASLGERLVAETRGRLEVLAEEIAPGRGARGVADDLAREHASASELVALYRAEMERSRAFTLERGLATFPDGEALTVLPTPEFAKLTSPYASYQAPAPYDREQRGFFFVTVPSENDHDALAGHNRFELVPTAVHEGYPGHHLQLSWANRHPSATRKQLWSPAYAEGWALYCEELFGEQGYYRDARERFAMVRGLLWRAARVVVDTGLHTGGLTFDSAVEYMVAHGLLDRPGAEAEVLRYTMVPAYQLCYQLGRLAIHELRGEVRRREGGRFDLRRFHDRLLATCTVPPALAAEEVLSELP